MKKSLSMKRILLTGGALFSMHFGASCLLYPMTWGKESGAGLWQAYLGVFISGILMTILGYIALARSNTSFLGMARGVSRRWGNAFCALVVLLVGPVYIIPRMTASTWDALAQLFPALSGANGLRILFNLLLYAVIFLFSIRQSRVVAKIGKVLFPIQMLIVAAVVLKGILSPIAPVMAETRYAEPGFVYGFLQGYSTGDLLCALLFGQVVVHGLAAMGLTGRALNRNLLAAGIVGIGLLALTHLGQMAVGAYSGAKIDLTLAALYAQVVVELWGGVGGLVFSLALLSTSISCGTGLTASSADFFVEISQKRLGYGAAVAATCLVSAGISCLSLNRIVAILGPLLQATYPAAILLVAFYAFAPDVTSPKHRRALLSAMGVASALALANVLYTFNARFGWGLDGCAALYAKVPLATYDLAWMPASALAYLAALLLGGRGKAKRPD